MDVRHVPAAGTPAPADAVTGSAWITSLAVPEGPSRTRVDRVQFAPGARTHWHRHPLGQVLVVTDGTGYVQRRGGPARLIRPGDTVRVAAGEWHWHGATDTTPLTHLAIEELPADGTPTEIGEPAGEGEPATVPAFTRTLLLDQQLPAPRVIDHVEIRRITIAPGEHLGLHVHNGPVFGSIETGSAVFQIEGEPETVLTPGDVFHEPESAWIARFDPQGDGVTFLAYFPVGPGETPSLTMLDS
ncbi:MULTISPECIES: cupin domain-containing protein [unclassified Amycolatopsis]|uniref:cupin domain-containing protein n=1 Tax=unclassified Amycolatopsis TaxID=2618356 RepID=UPI0028757B8A|nr:MULTISPECIES: cupin domain-containing protein [unclassified Amycolatopsis]MDS0136511.1 cupin domain-containing protein [Amycolatopsis sp. 505]MDS0143175.1 cupin domain-containing protein [Amycolatopsis sp. CM201R]